MVDVGFLHYSLDDFERPEREQACINYDHFWLTKQVATLEAVYLSRSSDPDFKMQEGERSRTERSDGLSQYSNLTISTKPPPKILSPHHSNLSFKN